MCLRPVAVGTTGEIALAMHGDEDIANSSLALTMSAVVVSPEDGLRRMLRDVLGPLGFSVRAFEDPERALASLASSRADILIVDANVARMRGLDVLRHVQEVRLGCDVILVTEAGDLAIGIAALREGATDFFEKPCEASVVHAAIVRTARFRTLSRQQELLVGRVQALSYELNDRAGGSDVMVGASSGMRKVAQDIVAYADSNATVLVLGESGTGKEAIAKSVHASGPRRDMPFLTLNCSAIAENLFESEMFGHRRGSFTGATDTQTGYVQSADGGSLFLDEIGDLPLGSQAKILRLLEQKTYLPVGENQEREANVRIVAATNQPLPTLVRKGLFREDLYYRLSVCTIHVPPLRERQDDIPLLALYFTLRFSAEMCKNVHGITDEALERLTEYDFPGNVRELRNIIESSVIRSHDKSMLDISDFPEISQTSDLAGGPIDFRAWPDERLSMPVVERMLYVEVLQRTNRNVSAAARLLGMDRSRFRRRLTALKLS